MGACETDLTAELSLSMFNTEHINKKLTFEPQYLLLCVLKLFNEHFYSENKF